MSPDQLVAQAAVQSAAQVESWVQAHLPLLVAGAVAVVVVAVLLFAAYQRYGLRLLYLLPWWVLKVLGAVLALVVIGAALLAGRRWRMPRFLRFKEEDPDRPLIERREAHPMQLQRPQRSQRSQRLQRSQSERR